MTVSRRSERLCGGAPAAALLLLLASMLIAASSSPLEARSLWHVPPPPIPERALVHVQMEQNGSRQPRKLNPAERDRLINILNRRKAAIKQIDSDWKRIEDLGWDREDENDKVFSQPAGIKALKRIFNPDIPHKTDVEESIKSLIAITENHWLSEGFETDKKRALYGNCVLESVYDFYSTHKDGFKQAILSLKDGSEQFTIDIKLTKYLQSLDDNFKLDAETGQYEMGDCLHPDPENYTVGTVPLSTHLDPVCLADGSDKRTDGTIIPYYPATAAILQDDGVNGKSVFCSGTLIAPNAVLTAAHCICDTHASSRSCKRGQYARLGASVSTLDPEPRSVFFQHAGEFEVSKIIVHPRYRWTGALPFGDLAIMVLKENVPGITPMALNDIRRLPRNSQTTSVGYGAHNPIDERGEIITTQTVVERAGLKLVAKVATGRCNRYERGKKMICWDYDRISRDGKELGSTCRGDSGGPLYGDYRGRPLLVGVTSAGGPSCKPGSRSYNVGVYPFRKWIFQQIRKNPPIETAGSPEQIKTWNQSRKSPASAKYLERIRAPVTRLQGEQIGCTFCELCGLPQKIDVPKQARSVIVTLNCSPDETLHDRRLSLTVLDAGSGATICPKTTGRSNVLSCTTDVTGIRQLTVKAWTGWTQQCQIVVTAR